MSEPDPHAPTSAGPAPEPTPVVPPSEATYATPAGSPFSAPAAQDKPEVLVGAAFAGGLVGAMILKRLTRGRRGR